MHQYWRLRRTLLHVVTNKVAEVDEQIGGQLEAGLVLTHIYGDTNGEGRLHEMNIECYFATRAVKL